MKQLHYDKIKNELLPQHYPEAVRLGLKHLEELTGLRFGDNSDLNLKMFYKWVRESYIPNNDKQANFEIQKELNPRDGDIGKVPILVHNYIITNFLDEYVLIKEKLNLLNLILQIHFINSECGIGITIDEIRYIKDSEIDDYLLNKIYLRDKQIEYENQIVQGKPYPDKNIIESNNTVNE